MEEHVLRNGYGPGRRDELVDRLYSIDDGLGRELPPESLHRAGLTASQLSDVALCMYEDPAQFASFDFSQYTSVATGYLPGNWYHDWVNRSLRMGSTEWFKTFSKLQPLSYALLTEPSSRLLGGYRRFFENGPPHLGHHVLALTVLIVRDRVICLRPYYTAPPEEVGVAGFEDNALPEVLLRSWWYRAAGYQIVREVPMSVNDAAQPLLQYPGTGTGVNDIVGALGAQYKRKHMPVLKELFGIDAVTKPFKYGRTALVCIIDTRPPETVRTPSGDQLFIHMGRTDQTVYHVRACRFDQMKKLDPNSLAECFDRYFAHVLARVPGEFDFTPYLTPL